MKLMFYFDLKLTSCRQWGCTFLVLISWWWYWEYFKHFTWPICITKYRHGYYANI